MYKNKDKAREASKERMRRMRQGVTKGVTRVKVEGVTKPDITMSDGKTYQLKGITVPAFARVLAPWTIDSIKAVLVNRAVKGLPDDSEKRWERAVSYHGWLCAGRPVYESLEPCP